MTKFIPVAFAIVALGASLSPALAGGRNGSGDNVVASDVATYTRTAPAATSAAVAPTYHYTGAEAAIINQNSRNNQR